ncbi:MgtC/SapB family protein [Pyxidicoccus sp. MSG2]|uniref:MgtC/SapB family protein n=1 Tax=Pyxidicoccus sp. MSG2 TaxID=2996790 RepID=UPI0022700FC0|nr:MgtC/SapB family protein [Pyxidicoccus sp. MSG2]MCY1023048.1 MgtC/SapB family protein [Pyxidicoccus sp. MSG2]
MFEWKTETELWARLVLAAFAGITLGLPYRRRPGGVRTHLLVTLGATLFCTTAVRFGTRMNEDVLRVLQGITSGIGFVGAASVLKRRNYILGITTAASIWVAAAVGCEAALGSPLLAAVLAPAVATLSWVVALLERRVFHRQRRVRLPGGSRPRS